MEPKEAADYLNCNHYDYFGKQVTAQTAKRWLDRGHIAELTTDALDNAVRFKTIPPKRGRPRKINT